MADDPQNDPPRAQPGPGADVVPLAQYRARLGGSGRALRRFEDILALPDPEQALRALPVDELYHLLSERGLGDAGDLLAALSAEQVQGVMDLGLWSGDRLAPARVDEWMGALGAAPPEVAAAWARGLDSELLGLLIRKGAHIYDLTMEEPPDEPEGIFYATPDRFFLLDAVGYRAGEGQGEGEGEAGGELGEASEGSAEQLIRFVDTLYRADKGLARRMLVGARAELDSSLEEEALRWRRGRLADLGFPDVDEAREVYRELDPASVRIGELGPGTRVRSASAAERGERLRAPAALVERLGASSPFSDAVSRIPAAAELEELHFALVALTNRVLTADLRDPGDEAGVKATVARVQATLDLAVDFLARGGASAAAAAAAGTRGSHAASGPEVSYDDLALDAVRTVPVLRLHRLGVSLMGKLRRLARTFGRHAALIEEPEATVLEAVSRQRPLYARALDSATDGGERPFAALADVARVGAAIRRAAAAQGMLLALDASPAALSPEALGRAGVRLGGGAGQAASAPPELAELDTAVLARTVLVRRLVAGELGEVARPGARGRRAGAVKSGAAKAGPGRRAPDATEEPIAFRPVTPDELRRFEARAAADRDSDRGLMVAARRILEAAAPPELGAAALEMIDRWLGTLSPLGPILLARPDPSPPRSPPRPRPRPAARPKKKRAAPRQAQQRAKRR